MGFLKRLFGGQAHDADIAGARADPDPPPGGPVADGDPSLHRVVAWIRLGDPTFESAREQQRLFALENHLMRALFESGAGDLDTNELARGFLALRFQGPDADAMTAVLVPLCASLPPGSYLAVRRGPYGAAEDRIDLEQG